LELKSKKKKLSRSGEIYLSQEKSIKVKKILTKSRKVYQGQEKDVMIKKNSSEPREPHRSHWKIQEFR
jgi:hypothetical protein